MSMHGFLNLAVAATLVFTQGAQLSETIDALDEQSPRAFEFTGAGLGWRGRRISLADLVSTRQNFLRSVTSCSLRDAVRELGELGLDP